MEWRLGFEEILTPEGTSIGFFPIRLHAAALSAWAFPLRSRWRRPRRRPSSPGTVGRSSHRGSSTRWRCRDPAAVAEAPRHRCRRAGPAWTTRSIAVDHLLAARPVPQVDPRGRPDGRRRRRRRRRCSLRPGGRCATPRLSLLFRHLTDARLIAHRVADAGEHVRREILLRHFSTPMVTERRDAGGRLPARLPHAGDHALEGELAQHDSADAELAVHAAGATGDLRSGCACGWRTSGSSFILANTALLAMSGSFLSCVIAQPSHSNEGHAQLLEDELAHLRIASSRTRC